MVKAPGVNEIQDLIFPLQVCYQGSREFSHQYVCIADLEKLYNDVAWGVLWGLQGEYGVALL